MRQFQIPGIQDQFNDLQNLATQITQRMQKCATEILNEYTINNNKNTEHLEKSKDLQDTLYLQLKLLNENRSHSIQCFKKVINTCLENIDDFNEFSNKWAIEYATIFNPLKLWTKTITEFSPTSSPVSTKRAQ